MERGLCDETKTGGALVKRAPIQPVAVVLRESGVFPMSADPLDPSPLAHLTPKQRRRRMVAILETLALHGDASAASEVLRHERWEDEMRRGKAPQRVDMHASGELRVIDTLSAPPGIPIVRRDGRNIRGLRRGTPDVVESQRAGDDKSA